MPPAENNTPAPQEPKKGFFAKLFGGGKKKDAAAPQTRQSQTPAPQLDDGQGQAPAAPVDTVASPVPAGDAYGAGPVGGTAPVVSAEPPVDSQAPPAGPTPTPPAA